MITLYLCTQICPRMRTFVLAYILILITFATGYAQPKHEIRAVWLTTLYSLDWPHTKATTATKAEKQRRELCQILDRLKEANFNTVLFQTRMRGDVIYPSAYEPYNECLTGTQGKSPGYDPLRFAIDECHKRGMELHAWVVTIPAGNTQASRSGHRNSPVKKHPELCLLHRKYWYMDPGNPKTKEYLNNIVKEIVGNYDVDGIHLDYIRYPDKPKGFPDAGTYRKYGKGKTLEQWRKNNITSIVRTIYTQVKAMKPWVKVSSAPIGKFGDTAHFSARGWSANQTVFQDAQKWLKEGIHDILFPMMYFTGNNFYPFALDWHENKNGRWIVPGLGIYFLSPGERRWELKEVTKQIRFTRNNGLDGHAYFRYEFLEKNTQGIADEIRNKYYTLPAVLPPMRWADSIPPTSPQMVEYHAASLSDTTMLRWRKSADNNNHGVYYRIYASDTYPVDTNNPQNIVSTCVRDTSYLYTGEMGYKRFWAVTATDRYGNESGSMEANAPQYKWANTYYHKIPSIERGETYVLRTLTGKVMSKGKHKPQDILADIKRGIYRIGKEDKTSQYTDLGILVW